ncbi:hypothetical protein ASPZODRAFT_70907 [Penicilliopsis zonata CBS 506.65]|uniref:Zn(2)-C6 fungal-type domain-containing protein n=1 Tax=Penicilliopsis zonata CBS 506.65 TaxID=1073090 RepID=A0A1L9SCF8_9EURO|nr:hypothetical protein ASPZODRAFT_70907 [Penicilliopsis zonata CBS 506.65]OJJ44809.1 hypothetical protein ASPZODRAFT_70907 [Penicilliopsis zonata CBS 506.65]
MTSETQREESIPLPMSTNEFEATQTVDSAKRKAEQTNGTHTRTKRNRYISIACNECKRRKIKCNGQVPCQRCGHLNLECRYAPNCCNNNFKESDDFRLMKQQITTLQEQVNTLFTKLNDFRDPNASLDSSSAFDGYSRDGSQQIFAPLHPGPSKPPSKHSRFHGPTSTVFNFNVAKSSLQTMGIAPPDDVIPDDLTTAHATPSGSPPPPISLPISTVHPSKDPIWSIKREEALRLCRVYEEEIGIMYPLINIEQVNSRANLLYTFMEAAARTGFAQRGMPGSDGLHDDDTNILKIILATTLVVEGNGRSDIGQRLYMSMKPIIESKIWQPSDLKTIQLFAIVAMYHFHTDDDIMAYRLIGVAARMCLELGLHRRDALIKSFPDEGQWPSVSNVFWSVYTLDRRWSFGTGLPFVIQDEDIDPNLPEPDSSLPYLNCMIAYNRISAKIWYSGLGSEGATDSKRDEIGYLDYQILQWYKQVPDTLRFYPQDSPRQREPANRGLQRLRVVLYLRMNQLRILIYRPVLHSTGSIVESRGQALTVVEIAKDTIRVLTHLNQSTDIYRSQQVTFNYFLLAALAVLFLAVSHAPGEFNRQVREEFYMALDLVSGFSAKSYVAKRLWKTIKGLRKIGEKLGVLNRPFASHSDDPHSTAAVAMAGLAGHPIEDISVYGPVGAMNELGNSPLNGLQMSQELTNLFEAVGGLNSFMASGTAPDGLHGFVGVDGEIQNTSEGLPGVLGNEGGFSRVIRDLF